VDLPTGKKLTVDIFNATSEEEHQFDLPFQYKGQFINTSFKYTANIKKQETLGTKSGYQFIWKEAEATAADTTIQFTFLNQNTFYTISSLIDGTAEIFFTRSGANDPNFNVRRETSYIIRKKGKNQSFINVVEIHGKYDPINEFSMNAYSGVKEIKLLQNDDAYSVTTFMVAGKKVLIAQCNKVFEKNKNHSLNINDIKIEWIGPYAVLYDGKMQ
jgi:oligo-alginate lyase